MDRSQIRLSSLKIQLWLAKLSRRPTRVLSLPSVLCSRLSRSISLIRAHDNEKVKEDSNALAVLVLKNQNAICDVKSRLNLAEEKLISVAKELEVEREKLEKLEKKK